MNLRDQVNETLPHNTTTRKSSADWAKKLRISVEEYLSIKGDITGKKPSKSKFIVVSVDDDNALTENQLLDRITEFSENLEKGTGEIKAELSSEPLSAADIEARLKITKDWKLVQYWNKSHVNRNGKEYWTISGNISRRKGADKAETEFIKFLETYEPAPVIPITKYHSPGISNGMLLLPNQDQHFDKHDVLGQNNIAERFAKVFNSQNTILQQSVLSVNLDKIVYVIGSDELNSESGHHPATTKGTPQINILPYHDSFEAVCNHEASCVLNLLNYTDNVEVVYISGNHDMFSGWHIASWLSAYFRNYDNIRFDISPNFTKYLKYNNSAVCINHGDEMKPEQLARLFPVNFKKDWSSCDNYYIFCGDKHTELSRSIGAIKFFRVAALSTAKSYWDAHKGYTDTPGEMSAFLIREKSGMSNIYKEPIT